MRFTRLHIASFLAILFHVSAVVGILCTPYKDWFIRYTPFNICLMTVLLLWTQPVKNRAFFLFLLITFLAGMGTEMIGVNTGLLFGHYSYGTVLGPGLYGVPWLIGLNWFLVVFCSGSVMVQVQDWFRRKFALPESQLPSRVAALSLVIDGALLAVFFDWIMEPPAIALGFWQWQDGEPPFYNYLCWFLISAILLACYRKLSFARPNHFAVHLFIIQALFFLALRTYL